MKWAFSVDSNRTNTRFPKGNAVGERFYLLLGERGT